MALGLESDGWRSDSDSMTTHNRQQTAQQTAADTWRDVWIDPDTARINARMAEVRYTESDMAEFYAAARNAIS